MCRSTAHYCLLIRCTAQMASQMMPLNQLPSNTAQRNPPRGSTSRRHALPPPPPLSMEPPVVPEVHSWRRDRRPSQHSLHPPAAPLHQQLLLQQAGRQMRRDAVLQRQPRQRAARLPRQQHCRRRLRLYRGRQWHLQLTGRAPLVRFWTVPSRLSLVLRRRLVVLSVAGESLHGKQAYHGAHSAP